MQIIYANYLSGICKFNNECHSETIQSLKQRQPGLQDVFGTLYCLKAPGLRENKIKWRVIYVQIY